MLLAPSFSPKVRTVLDCLFNAVRALAGRTFSSFSSTSRSFSYSVVLAMPVEAWEAPMVSQAAGAAQKRGTAHSMPLALSPRLCWTWTGMRTCRRSLSFSIPAPSCCMQCPAWAAVLDHHGQGREEEGQPRQPCSVLERKHPQICSGPSHTGN